jgi:hypothetical protein
MLPLSKRMNVAAFCVNEVYIRNISSSGTRSYALCLNIDVASTKEVDNEIFASPEGEHSEKGIAA